MWSRGKFPVGYFSQKTHRLTCKCEGVGSVQLIYSHWLRMKEHLLLNVKILNRSSRYVKRKKKDYGYRYNVSFLKIKIGVIYRITKGKNKSETF